MSLGLNTTTDNPVLPSFAVSGGLGATVFQSRAQTEQTRALGEAFSGLFRGLWNALRGFHVSINNALALRELAGLNDRMLADIGITRSQIPQIITRGGFDQGIETAVNSYLASTSSRAST